MPTSKQRRAAERRRLRRQAQRRQQQATRRRNLNVILSVVGTLLIFGVVVTLVAITSGGSDSKPKAGASTSPRTSATPSTPAASPTTSATTTTTAATSTAATSTAAASTSASSSASASRTSTAPAATTTCSYPRSGTAARTVRTPSTKALATGAATVRLATSRGAMTFTLDRATAPCAVNSFVSLARQKYYDNTSCHRLVDKSIFVLQCGDPTGTGRGGPGYRFADELGTDPVFRRGTLVMANGGPNTNGSQFFIIDRNTRLGANYTPLGTVSGGLSVADAVYQAGTSDGSTDGPPKLPLTFRTLTVS